MVLVIVTAKPEASSEKTSLESKVVHYTVKKTIFES